MATKICSKCKEEKDIEGFCNDKGRKDGKHNWCKQCCKIHKKTYNKVNKEKIKEYCKRYKEENKEKRTKQLAKANAKYYKKNKEKIKEYKKIYYKNNKEKKQEYRKTYIKEYNSSLIKYSHPMIKELSIYDQVTKNKEGFTIVQCTYCGSDVIPTTLQVRNRINACNNLNKGEQRIYCSDQCKNACPSHKRRKYPLGYKKASSREVDLLLRQLCFKRDQYICQHCGISIKEAQLHCHHIIGVTQSPIEQNDLSNVITLCKKCHKELHKTKGCTYQDYQCS